MTGWAIWIKSLLENVITCIFSYTIFSEKSIVKLSRDKITSQKCFSNPSNETTDQINYITFMQKS